MEEKKSHADKTSQKPRNQSGMGPFIFVSIFVILLAVATGLLLRQVFESRAEAEIALQEKNQAIAEKQELQDQLHEIEEDYIELSSKYDHLEEELRQAGARISRLRSELEGVDPADARQFREEIEQLEQQLEEYRQQIEDLERENQALASEKSQMQSTVDEVTSRFDRMEQEKERLQEKVEQASYLTICEFTVQPIRERWFGREEITDRARRTDRIEICFTVNENPAASPGVRDFHIRIMDPHNNVLSSTGNVYELENGEEINYSLSRQIDYENEQEEVCVTWTQDERYLSGYYNVNIYTEGREVGYKLFELD